MCQGQSRVLGSVRAVFHRVLPSSGKSFSGVTRRVIRVAKNLLCQEMIGFQHKTYFDSFSNEGDPMTQMMLFDAPANTATVPVPDFVGRDSNPRGVSWERSSEKRFCGSRSVHAKKASCEAIGVSGRRGFNAWAI